MGLFNWLMKGIGFEGEEEDVSNANALAEEKRKYKEMKKQEKMAKKLARQQAKNERMKKPTYESFEQKNGPSETVFTSEPKEEDEQMSFSSFDPDQYNMASQPQSYGGYDSGYGSSGYGSSGYNKNIIFFYPKSYSEVQKLIDYLRNGESVMLNLDGISDDEAQRMLDFASGAVYAISGSIQRVSGNIFILTPEGLGIVTPKR